jgi:hypothetical protein
MSILDATKNWFGEWLGTLIGLAVLGGGVFGLVRGHGDLCYRLSDAAIVAGVVTVAVDPFVKRKLVGEISKDIFRYLLGFELPKAIRDALQDHLFKTANYREDVQIEAEVASVGDHVDVVMTATGKVVAIKDCKYNQYAAFEESEQGQVLGASIQGNRDSSKDYVLTSDNIVLLPKPDEPMVFEWNGATVEMRAGEKLSYRLQTKIQRARFDFLVQNFGAAILGGTIVRVSGSDDLEVTASKSERLTGNEYSYERVFLPGDHIQIRWKPRGQ